MPKVDFICSNCNRQFQDYVCNRTKSKDGDFYCSRKCKGEHQTKKAIARAPQKTESACRTCGMTKPIGEFYKDSHCRANGYIQYSCKECVKLQRMAYYDANREAVIARVKKYATEHPEVSRRHGRKQREMQSLEQGHAHAKLNREVAAGRITKPDRCQKCHGRKKLHGHHHKGYAPKNALDVVWVCVRCHHELHGRGPNCRPMQSAQVNSVREQDGT